MIHPISQLFLIQVNESSHLIVKREPGNFKVLVDSHSNPLFQICLGDSSLLCKHSNLSRAVDNIKLTSLIFHDHSDMVCEASRQQHPLRCIAREPPSDQNITCFHLGWVHIDEVDNSLLQLDAAKLFNKPGVCFFHINCGSFAEGGEILACSVAANPHKGRRHSALKHCEGVGTVCEKANAIHLNIRYLPRVTEGELDFFLAFSHVEVVLVREGCADLQVLHTAKSKLFLEGKSHRSLQLSFLLIHFKVRKDFQLHEAVTRNMFKQLGAFVLNLRISQESWKHPVKGIS